MGRSGLVTTKISASDECRLSRRSRPGEHSSFKKKTINHALSDWWRDEFFRKPAHAHMSSDNGRSLAYVQACGPLGSRRRFSVSHCHVLSSSWTKSKTSFSTRFSAMPGKIGSYLSRPNFCGNDDAGTPPHRSSIRRSFWTRWTVRETVAQLSAATTDASPG